MIAGVVAVKDFPLAPRCVADLAARVDHLVLWIDPHLHRPTVGECIKAVGKVPLTRIRSKLKWNRWNWRAEMLAAVDKLKPAYVLAPDSDEMFADDFAADWTAFVASGRDLMMFHFEMATDDGRTVPRYPRARHCKAFRWRPGLTFRPYRGYARPGPSPLTEFVAATRIRHLCFFTAAMQAGKTLHR